MFSFVDNNLEIKMFFDIVFVNFNMGMNVFLILNYVDFKNWESFI